MVWNWNNEIWFGIETEKLFLKIKHHTNTDIHYVSYHWINETRIKRSTYNHPSLTTQLNYCSHYFVPMACHGWQLFSLIIPITFGNWQLPPLLFSPYLWWLANVSVSRSHYLFSKPSPLLILVTCGDDHPCSSSPLPVGQATIPASRSCYLWWLATVPASRSRYLWRRATVPVSRFHYYWWNNGLGPQILETLNKS